MKHIFGKLSSGIGYPVPTHNYDQIVELSIVENGKHKGEVRIDVGREPDENFPVTELRAYSKHGKKSVHTGYIPLDKLRGFLDDNIR